MYNKPTGGLFGGAANTSFGSTSFGATSSPFGANQGASFGGTAFGNTQTSSGGMFGSSGGTGLFGGTSTQGGGLFGGTSAFGNTNATSNTNTFGFGSGVQATTQQSMGLFGNTSTNTFGGTSLFGQQQQPQQQSTFGQTGGSLFGGMVTGGGFLGGSQTTGTTIKFVPVVSSEQMVKGGVTTNINTKLQCITAMKEYESKSLEELRLEDYGANRKSGAVMGGGFGLGTSNAATGFMSSNQPQQTGFSMFGNQNKTGFSGFGATSTAAGSTSLFGGFGAQSKPLFGSSSLPSTTAPTNTFGGLNTGSTFFGANNNKFGAASTQPSLGFSFGATQQTNSPFGLSTSQNNTTGGFFGKKPALGFGQPAASSAASVPAFGLKPANQTAFGTPTFGTGTSLFNKPAATSASPFGFGATGSTSLGFGGFGAQQNTLTSLQAPSFGSLGSQAPAANTLFGANKGSLFGASNPPAFNLGGSFINSSLTATSNTGLASRASAAPNEAWVQQIGDHIKALNKSPYGDSPLLKNLILDPQRKEELTRPTNPVAQKSLLVSHMKTTSLKTTPKSFSPSTKVNIFNDFEDEDANLKATFNSSSTKRNYKELKPQALASDHKLKHSTDRSFTQGLDYASDEYFSPEKFKANLTNKTSPKSYFNASINGVDHGGHADNTIAEFNVIKDLNKTDNNSKDAPVSSKKISFSKSGVVLSRRGYYTIPNMKKLDGMVDENGECWVDGLVVGRDGYGSVTFPGLTNVAGLNLDNIIFFSTKELEIYPEESSKPPVGEGLNKRAQVTLEKAYPIDKSTGKLITDYTRLREMGYIKKLQKKSVKMGAQFVDFNKQGEFIFLVEHFSKYSLLDDSDDSDGDQTTPNKPLHPIKALQAKQVQLSTATTTLPADHLTSTAALKLFSSTLNQQLKVQQQNYSPIYPNIINFANDTSSDEEDESKVQSNEMACNEQEVPMVGGEEDAEDDDVDLVNNDDQVRSYGNDGNEDEGHDYDEDQDKYQRKDDKTVGSRHYVGLGGFVEEDEEEEKEEEENEEYIADDGMEGVEYNVVTDMYHRGVTSKNLQIHKAHFFDEDEEEDGGVMKTDVVMGGKEDTPMAAQSFLRDKFKEVYPLSPKPLSTLSQPLYPETKVAPPVSHHTLDPIFIPPSLPDLSIPDHLITTPIPLNQSVMLTKLHSITDVALFHANSFRPCFFNNSFHQGWHFTNLSEALYEEATKEDKVSLLNKKAFRSGISVMNLQSIDAPLDASQKSHLVSCLQVELNNSVLNGFENINQGDITCADGGSDADVCPFVDFSSNAQALMTDMIGCLKSLSNQSEWTERMLSVWRLCWALWGEIKEPVDGRNEMNGETNWMNDGGINGNYFTSRVRKMRLSQWLSRSCRRVIESKIEIYKKSREKRNGAPNDNEDDDGYITFNFMTGGMVNRAIQSALSARDNRLALLLSQNTMNNDNKLMLRKQIDQWISSKADFFISEHRLMLMSLLSGILQVSCNNKQLNCCEHLDWKRAFGLHLWYTTPSNHPIEIALKNYQENFMDANGHTPKPWPVYMENITSINGDGHNSSRVKDRVSGKDEVYDVVFGLLQLFSDMHYPLHVVLNPLCFTSQHLDYTSSWHLLKLLGSLNYRHFSDQHLAYICHSYASQLEVSGLWWWAVFVLMHINNPVTRKDAVKKLLMRNVTSNEKLTDEDDEEEDDGDDTSNDDYEPRGDLITDANSLLNERDLFVVEKLTIPRSWLHEAKAIKAQYMAKTYTQLRHSFRAGLYNQCSTILQQNLLSDMVVKGMYTAIRYWVSPLLSVDSSVANLSLLKLYVQFVDAVCLVEKMNDYLQEQREEGQREEGPSLKHLLNEISSSIHLLPTHSPINKLAQSIISKTVSKGVDLLLSFFSQSQHNDDDYTFLANIEGRLPLPLNCYDTCPFDKVIL